MQSKQFTVSLDNLCTPKEMVNFEQTDSCRSE